MSIHYKNDGTLLPYTNSSGSTIASGAIVQLDDGRTAITGEAIANGATGWVHAGTGMIFEAQDPSIGDLEAGDLAYGDLYATDVEIAGSGAVCLGMVVSVDTTAGTVDIALNVGNSTV